MMLRIVSVLFLVSTMGFAATLTIGSAELPGSEPFCGD